MNAEALVTARFLRAARGIDWLSMGLTLVAAAESLWIAVAIGLVAKYLSFRIAFDARLFEDLANERMTLDEFDEAAVALQLMPQKKTGRAIADRCRGAKKLVTFLVAATLAQAIALAAFSF